MPCEFAKDDRRRNRSEQVFALEAASETMQRFLALLHASRDDHQKVRTLLDEFVGLTAHRKVLSTCPELHVVIDENMNVLDRNSNSNDVDLAPRIYPMVDNDDVTIIGASGIYDENMLGATKTSANCSPNDDSNIPSEQGSVIEFNDPTRPYPSPARTNWPGPIPSEDTFAVLERSKSHGPGTLLRHIIDSPLFYLLATRSYPNYELFPSPGIDRHFILPALVYAACALTLVFETGREPPICDTPAHAFYQRAMDTVLCGPDGHTTMNASNYARIQALLLLAHYDLCRGDLTSAWCLTGLAVRTGQDSGFDNPYKHCTTPIITTQKWRLYRACFLMDFFLGLVYGRPRMMKVEPDYTQTDMSDLVRLSFDLVSFAGPMIKATFQLLPFATAQESKNNFLYRYNKLKEYNVRLLEWRRANADALDQIQNRMPLFFYFLVVLIMNRPFIQLGKHDLAPSVLRVADECEHAIRLYQQETSETGPVYFQDIRMAYALILITNMLHGLYATLDNKTAMEAQIRYFTKFLETGFTGWAMIEHPLEILRGKLRKLEQEIEASPPEFKLENGTPANNDPFMNMMDSFFSQQHTGFSIDTIGGDALGSTGSAFLNFDLMDTNFDLFFDR